MLITDLPLWEDCPLLQRIPPEVEIRRGATASGKEVFVLWDRVRNKQVSYEAEAFDQPTLDMGLAILSRSPVKPPSEVEADRLEASNAAVDEVKRQIETERSARDGVVVATSMIVGGSQRWEMKIGSKGRGTIAVCLEFPFWGDPADRLALSLRTAADEIDAAIVRLTEDQNAQGT